MIDRRTSATTAEICSLAGFTKQRLNALERTGVVQRSGRDRWPLIATINKIFEDGRARRSATSASRASFERARAAREQQRLEREANQLVATDEFDAAWTLSFGFLVSRLIALPGRCSRDLAVRREIEAQVNALRTECANEYQRHAASLRANGKAAPFGK